MRRELRARPVGVEVDLLAREILQVLDVLVGDDVEFFVVELRDVDEAALDIAAEFASP